MDINQAAGRAQAFKRDVYIRDDSGTSVNVTLWGAFCTTPGDQLEEVRPPRKIKKEPLLQHHSKASSAHDLALGACAPVQGAGSMEGPRA